MTRTTKNVGMVELLTAAQSGASLLLCLAIALLSSALCFAQQQTELRVGHYKIEPLHGNSPAQALRESAAGQTVPLWSYEVMSPKDGNIYSGQIMGTDWIGTDGYTKAYIIPTILVPVIVNLLNPNGGVAFTYDPTAVPPACAGGIVPLAAVQASPLFDTQVDYKWGNPQIDLGETQYVDALLRAEFWTIGHHPPSFLHNVNFDYWHVQFDLNTIGAVTINVPSGFWGVRAIPCVGSTGAIDYAWFDNYLETTLIPSLASQGVGPTILPVFLTYNVVTSPDHGLTAYLGYHGSYGSPMQVYVEAMFDATGAFSNSADITPLSHEMAEVMHDPTGSNPTPAWGHIGQVSNCQSNFEVGDPLSGTQYPSINLNGYTYHLQEMAFWGWFFDGWPATLNWGIPGWYSSNGAFTGTAKTCPPGGTN